MSGRPFDGGTRARCSHCGSLLVREEGPLTKRQSEIYAYLMRYSTEHGYAPLFSEIGAQFGYRSLSSVHEILLALETKGWIRREFNAERAIVCLVAPLSTELAQS
jgi:SOS-response transcriptional repressor LexA